MTKIAKLLSALGVCLLGCGGADFGAGEPTETASLPVDLDPSCEVAPAKDRCYFEPDGGEATVSAPMYQCPNTAFAADAATFSMYETRGACESWGEAPNGAGWTTWCCR